MKSFRFLEDIAQVLEIDGNHGSCWQLWELLGVDGGCGEFLFGGEVAVEDAAELFGLEGFADVVVHAGGQAAVAVAL